VVVPVWDRFLATYPEVHLELHVGDAPIDAGLGPHDRAAADMIVVRVTGPMKIAIVGARGSERHVRPMISPAKVAFNTICPWVAALWCGR
jgi:hypothetical protein